MPLLSFVATKVPNKKKINQFRIKMSYWIQKFLDIKTPKRQPTSRSHENSAAVNRSEAENTNYFSVIHVIHEN